MSAKHTAGPWEWDDYTLRPATPAPERSAVHTVLTLEHRAFGYVDKANGDVIEEDEANHRLIAAAPDLLAALLRAADTFADTSRYYRCLGKTDGAEAYALAESDARAAIARATGAAA